MASAVPQKAPLLIEVSRQYLTNPEAKSLVSGHDFSRSEIALNMSGLQPLKDEFHQGYQRIRFVRHCPAPEGYFHKPGDYLNNRLSLRIGDSILISAEGREKSLRTRCDSNRFMHFSGLK